MNLTHTGEKYLSNSIAVKVISKNEKLIRFIDKNKIYSWVQPNEIWFVKSADHYVKCLVRQGKHTKWLLRHATLKEMLTILPKENFVRLNKFYLLNKQHFLQFDKNEKILYFSNNFSIAVPHRISPFVLNSLKK